MQTDPFANAFFLADLINFSTSSNKFANICYPFKLVPFKRLFMQIYQFYRVVFSRFFFCFFYEQNCPDVMRTRYECVSH